MRATAVLLLAGWAAPSRAAQPASAFQQGAALFSLKCAKCHSIGQGDRVGPDLRGVASRHPKEWTLSFIMHPNAYLDSDPVAKALMQKYHGVRMEETHLSRAEAEGVLAYVEAAGSAPAGPPEPAPIEEEPLTAKLRMPEEGRSVGAASLALTLAFLAGAVALWQWEAPASAAVLLVLAAASGYWSFGGRRYHRLLGSQQGYMPEQPIAFSHAKHAGQLRISCFYCHGGAEKSDVAGVPPLNVCMNCHVAVKKDAASEEPSADIAKLAAAWEDRERDPSDRIEWIRVHQLPDFVHFSHRVHVANNIQCQECHGPVQTMSTMRQAASLSMGWCVDCHRLKPGDVPTHWKRSRGPLDCAACHW